MKLLLCLFLICYYGKNGIIINQVHYSQIYKEKLLPVCISYQPKEPPDSVQQYLKDAFETKKIKIINKNELERLIKAESERVFNIVRNNGFSDPQSLISQIDRLTQPVCNSLQINFKFFKDQNSFSLQWKTYTQPVNPTKTVISDWRSIDTEKIKEIAFRSAMEAIADSIILSKQLQ